MKKSKVSPIYKETQEERANRVRNEGRRFRSRVEPPKTLYKRQKFSPRDPF